MKILFSLMFTFLLLKASAQKETFDLVNYTVPKDSICISWKKELSETMVSYTAQDKTGGWCRIYIVKSTVSKGSIDQDFENEWQELVVKNYKPEGSPQLNEVIEADGWMIRAGGSKFLFNKSDALVMLTTMSGYKRSVSIVTITNSHDYLPAIQSLILSLNLTKPSTANTGPSKPQKDVQQELPSTTVSADALTKNTWKSHQNRKDGSGGSAGYSTNSYQFFSNGTYSYSNKTFQYHTPKYYTVEETGSYVINGNSITLKPGKSNFYVRKLKPTDPVSKSGSTGFKMVQYHFEYATVAGRSRLVLTPADGNKTVRDGPFNYYDNGQITKSYLYDAEEFTAVLKDKSPAPSQEVVAPAGFAFTTTNFDDGWTSTVREEWVEVKKGNVKVLIHYPNKDADAYNSDLMGGLKQGWDVLVAPRYSSATGMEFKPIYAWESIEFADAVMVEKETGKSVYVVFFMKNYYSGHGRYLEFITPDKNTFEQQFGSYENLKAANGWDKLAAMANYNKFAVASSDLKGKWTSDFSGMTQYVNAYTGADAGANTHASNENFEFGQGSSYKWDLGVASGFVGNIKFQSVKSSGTFSVVNNWQVRFSDIEGKPKIYDVHFTCIKGARVLWIGQTGFGKKE